MNASPTHARPGTPAARIGEAPRAGGWHPLALLVAICAWTATVGNLPLWKGMHAVGALDGGAGLLLGLSMALGIFGLLALLTSVFAWRGLLKPALLVVLLSQAFAGHYMLAYNVVIDPTMMVNVLQTDPREVGDLVGWPLWRNLSWLLLPPLVLLAWAPLRPVRFGRRLRQNLGLAAAMVVLTVAAVVVSFQPLSSTMRNHKSLRYLINPLNGFYAVGSAAAEPFRRPRGALQVVGADAHLRSTPVAGRRPMLIVLVLGETGRVGNFGINGYERDTTPGLAREPVVSYRDVVACGTSTAASVPCMFSPLGREGWLAREQDQENVLDVLQRAGLAVLWLENQAGCKGVCDRVPSANTQDTRDPVLCPDDECLDDVLLQGLDQRLDALPAERRARGTVVVLHTMGSHGPAYFKRSPPDLKPFQPECRSVDLQRCTRDEVRNAYDNSIVQVDRFLMRTIRWLESKGDTTDTAMTYIADHGESLGEHNLYLHGLPWSIAPAEQKQVPWITWLSPQFQRRSGLNLDCLRRQAELPLSHDNLFHSILGLADVETAAYRPSLDIHAACARG